MVNIDQLTFDLLQTSYLVITCCAGPDMLLTSAIAHFPGCQMSEPIVALCMRVLDCEPSVQEFLRMGGVEVLCRRLVHLSQRAISTSPSLISGMMQYLGATRIKAWKDTDPIDGMHNFAPICKFCFTTKSTNI